MMDGVRDSNRFCAALRDDPGSRLRDLKMFDWNLIGYLFLVSLLVVVFRENREDWFFYGGLHAACIPALFCLVSWLERKDHALFRFWRHWYIVLALPLIYWDTGLFVHLVFPQEFDPMIIEIDRRLFGGLPFLWVQAYENRGLTELMQTFYCLYWVTIPLAGAVFYFKKEYRLYETLMNSITMIFWLSCTIFILFPVSGPRFFVNDQIQVPYQGLLWGGALRDFVRSVAFRGGAFPSLHIAAAVTIFLFVRAFHRKMALFVFLPSVAAFSLSTVYGQYHYVTDVLAGLVMGLVAGVWAVRAARRMGRD